MNAKNLFMPVKEFTPEQALEYCFKLIKPSKMEDEKLYQSFREYRRKYRKDPNNLGAGARDTILKYFGFEMVYKKDVPKK